MRPSSVSASWRVVRTNNGVPKCCSSAEIGGVTEVRELGRGRAGADRLPASTTRTKVAIAASWSNDVLSFRFQQETISDLHNTAAIREGLRCAGSISGGEIDPDIQRSSIHGPPPRSTTDREPELPACLLGHGIVAALPCAACAK